MTAGDLKRVARAVDVVGLVLVVIAVLRGWWIVLACVLVVDVAAHLLVERAKSRAGPPADND